MSLQRDMILKHLETIGPITGDEAKALYAIARLPSRISELKKEGVPIKSQTVTGLNKFGIKTHWSEYWLQADAKK